MNKSDVIERVAGAAGATKQQVESVLDAFFDTVRGSARGGDRVAWPGFGAFSTTQRKARTGRNPRTGESVKIAASRAMKFTPSSTLKDFLNAGAGAKKGRAKKATAKKTAPLKTGAPAKAGPAKKAAAPVKKASKTAASKTAASKTAASRTAASRTAASKNAATGAPAKASAPARKATKKTSKAR